MTSRAGSLLVLALLGVLTVVAIVLILTLVGDDAGEPPVLTLSLRDGDLVSLNEPLEIRVTARAEEPVTGVALFVDEALVTQAVPVADPGRGTFSASLNWTPDRLGAVTITVVATKLSGTEATIDLQIQVIEGPVPGEDSTAVVILSPTQLQQVSLEQPATVLARAAADTQITSMVLVVDGVEVAQTRPTQTENGQWNGIFEWQPTEEGPVTLVVLARAGGEEVGSAQVTVEVVSGPVAAPPSAEGEPGGGGLTIESPADNSEFAFREGLSIDLSIAAVQTGPLAAVELYANTVLVTTATPEPLSEDLYRFILPFEPTEPGAYVLEVVAISADNQRYDDTVVISVLGEDGSDDTDAGLPDLIPTAVSVGEGNSLVLTLANNGLAALQSTPILVGVSRSSDGVLLGETILNVTLSREGSRAFTLPIQLTEAINITVEVDTGNAVRESNEGNNTLTTRFEPLLRPDLTAQGLQVSADGIPIVRVSNIGAADYSGPLTVLLLFNGQPVEALTFDGALAAQGSLTLAGSVPITGAGQLSAVVDPTDLIAEANEGNNTLTITLSG